MTQMYKMLRPDLKHYGFQYKEGLNVDTVPFNPSGVCEPGGLYYTDLHHLAVHYWNDWTLIADVSIPPDAQIYSDGCGTKWKADRLVLSNIRPLHTFLSNVDEMQVVEWLKSSTFIRREFLRMLPSDVVEQAKMTLRTFPWNIRG